MTIDVIDLRDFYSKRLGVVARRLINRGIKACWPEAAGERVVGLGYPTPYLGLFRENAERCIAMMPAARRRTVPRTVSLRFIGLSLHELLSRLIFP